MNKLKIINELELLQRIVPEIAELYEQEPVRTVREKKRIYL